MSSLCRISLFIFLLGGSKHASLLVCEGKVDMQNLVSGSFSSNLLENTHTHTHTLKSNADNMPAQRNPLFLIYFVSVYQLSLVAHTHTHTNKHTHTCNPGENKHPSDLPSSGLCGLSVKFPSMKTRVDLETEQRQRRLTSRCRLAKVRRHDKDAQLYRTERDCAHNHERFSASPQTPSHLPPSEQHWSDPGVSQRSLAVSDEGPL